MIFKLVKFNYFILKKFIYEYLNNIKNILSILVNINILFNAYTQIK